MVLENLKKILDKNSILMSIMALIFMYLSMMSKKEMQNLNISYNNIIFQGLVTLSIVYISEISKTLLLEDKILKRIEFLIGNGITLFRIIIENTLSLLVSVLIILLPTLMLIIYKDSGISILNIMDYIFTLFIYSIISNVWILNTENLNKIKSLQVKLVGLTILIQIISNGLFYFFKGLVKIVCIRYIILIILLCLMLSKLSKERVIDSYY